MNPHRLFQERGGDAKARCQELQEELDQSHKERESLISSCLQFHQDKIEGMGSTADKSKLRASKNLVKIM